MRRLISKRNDKKWLCRLELGKLVRRPKRCGTTALCSANGEDRNAI